MIDSGTGCHEPAEGPDHTDSFWTGIAATVLSLAIGGIGFPLLNTMELKPHTRIADLRLTRLSEDVEGVYAMKKK